MARLILFGVVILGIGVAGLGIWLLRSKLEQVRSWPAVQATVVRSWVEERKGDESTFYAVGYEFAYSYMDHNRRATVYSRDNYSRSGADRMVAKHYAGSAAQIHVNPEKPDGIDPNLGRNAATLSGALWVIVTGVSIAIIAAPICIMITAGDNW